MLLICCFISIPLCHVSVTNYYRLLLTQMKPASKLTCLCIYFSHISQYIPEYISSLKTRQMSQ